MLVTLAASPLAATSTDSALVLHRRNDFMGVHAPGLINFAGVTATSYTNATGQTQDVSGSLTVDPNNDYTIHLQGNIWKSIAFSDLGYNTPININTVLSFEIKAEGWADIISIGIDNDAKSYNHIKDSTNNSILRPGKSWTFILERASSQYLVDGQETPYWNVDYARTVNDMGWVTFVIPLGYCLNDSLITVPINDYQANVTVDRITFILDDDAGVHSSNLGEQTGGDAQA